MDASEAANLPYRLSEPRHHNIHRRLNLVGAGAQTFYFDVCRLRDTQPLFETTTHLIGHLIREIESSLRDVLLVFAESSERPQNNIHAWEISQIITGLDISNENPVVELWLRHAPTLAHARAHRDNLQPPRPVDKEFLQYVDEMETIFDFILTNVEAKYLTIFDALDKRLLVDPPTAADAKWLKNIPNNPAALGYFFSRLNDPRWLPLLKAEGAFNRPPEPIQGYDGERSFTSFPTWPLSKYLVRMAAIESVEVSEQIADILVGIKTTNFIIHLDIVDAACVLPIDLAERVAKNEVLWLWEQQFIGHLTPDKFADLTIYLSNGGKAESALAIAAIMLGFVDNETHELSAVDNYFGPDPRTRVERWDYGQFIHKSWQSLAHSDPLNSLRLFCSLLDEYLGRKYPERLESAESYSYIWHRSIDQDEDGIPNRLVSAVRSTAKLALEEGSTISEIIGVLDSYKWDVFPRIVLYLLNLHPFEASEEVKNRLLIESNFKNLDFFHEYVLLLATFFNNLEPDEKEIVFGWINDSAPSIEEVKRRQLEWNGTELSDEKAEMLIRSGKLKWLEPLKDVLPDEWRQKYDDWTEELGHIPHPSYAIGVAQATWGENLPVSDSLSHIDSVEGIAEYLTLPEGELNDSPSNLGRELEQLVRDDLQRFLPKAERFEGLAPVYVHGFISGVRSSSQSVPEDSWPNLLRLMNWVMAQPAAEVDLSDNRYEPTQTDWLQTRYVISEFVRSFFSKDRPQVPFSLRDDVWSILQALTEDPNPTQDYEARYGGTNMNPLTVSLNTIRGSAFHTLSKYLYWCREHLDVSEGIGLDPTPEVREVLNRHLDPAIDSSLAVRAVYGERVPSLVSLDPDWVKEHLDEIFPNDGDLRKSAWQTFIIYTRPWNNVFALLRQQYEEGVMRLGEESLYGSSENVDNHLAEHLIAFYARGLIQIGDGNLLDKFYEQSSDSLAAHIFWYIARIVREGTIPREILDRFVRLIDLRVANGQNHPVEMEAFGWLFGTGKFDTEWSLDRMKDTLEISSKSNPDHSVVEELSKFASSFPGPVIECLTHLVDGADTEWKIQYWSPHLRTAIKIAREKGEGEPVNLLVNKLAARGFVDFRDLLHE